jgi:hypothetical protein
MKGKIMSNKTHNVTSLPKDAPRADEETEATETHETPSRARNLFNKNKRFLAGVGAGVVTAVTVLAVVRSNSADEETEADAESTDN